MSDSNQSPAHLLNLRHIIGVLLISLAALWLTACSTIQFAYQNAPELTYWWLDSYLDFNDTQSARLREDLASLQVWHRQRELPIYVKTLDKLQKMAPNDTTPEQMCDLYAEVKTRLQATLDQFQPTVSSLAPALKSNQIDHLSRQFEKRNRKWREEWLETTVSERNARRLKQVTERAENFYGRLDERQLAVLRTGLMSSPLDVNLSYREALRRQQDMLQTLRQLQNARPGTAGVQTAMRGLLERSIESPEPVHRNYMERMTQANCHTFSALHNSSSAVQRSRLLETLKNYQADARALTLPAP